MPYIDGGSLRDLLDREGRLAAGAGAPPRARGGRRARLRAPPGRDPPRHQAREHPARGRPRDRGRLRRRPGGERRGRDAGSPSRRSLAGTPAYMSPEQADETRRSTAGATSTRSAACCTRCSPASRRSRRPRRSRDPGAASHRACSEPRVGGRAGACRGSSTSLARTPGAATGGPDSSRPPSSRARSPSAERQLVQGTAGAGATAAGAAARRDGGAPVRQRERRSGERVLQRRDDRGADHRARPGRGPAGGVARRRPSPSRAGRGRRARSASGSTSARCSRGACGGAGDRLRVTAQLVRRVRRLPALVGLVRADRWPMSSRCRRS